MVSRVGMQVVCNGGNSSICLTWWLAERVVGHTQVSVPRKNERKSSLQAALVVSGVNIIHDSDDLSFCLASW